MSFTNNSVKKVAATIAGAGLLSLSFFMASTASAVSPDINIATATTGTVVQASNSDATVVATFSPDLNLAAGTDVHLTDSATGTTAAYYGVHTTVSTSSSDVHFRVVVNHVTDTLAAADVSLATVGQFDASGHNTTVMSYGTASETSGNLTFDAPSVGMVSPGDDFTDVEKITFAPGAPLGEYIVSYAAIDGFTGAQIGDFFNFSITLDAASSTPPDTTAPAAPVVLYPSSPISTSTSPVMVWGTAEANSSIRITGGSSTSTATTTAGGSWNTSVSLTASSTNNLSVTATDASGNTSAATLLSVTFSASSTGTSTPPTSTTTPPTATSTTATSSPSITLTGDATMNIFSCNGFVEPGFSAVNSAGAVISASSTGTAGIGQPGTYTITYTATDASGHTATTTRTVVVQNCSSGSHGSSRAAQVTPLASSIPGNAFGVARIQAGVVTNGFSFPGIPATAGEVLGVSVFQFTHDLSFGMSGPEVVELQTRLTSTGLYHAPITGFFGSATRAAVKRLQRNNGLSATGVVDFQTRLLLNS